MSSQGSKKTSRQKLEYVYSMLILVIIPILIIVQSLVMNSNVRNSFDLELESKAELANAVLGESIKSNLNDSDIQQSLNNVVGNIDDIEAATVIEKNDSSFTIIAASSASDLGRDVSQNPQITRVVQTNSSDSVLTESSSGNRSWNIVSPVYDDDLELIGLVETSVSLEDSDALISSLITKSLFILLATVAVIVVLLLSHTNFAQYPLLFRKLKEVDGLKSDFLTAAANQLETPTNSIEASIKKLLDGEVGHIDNKARKSLATVYEDSSKLNDMVTSLLEVSRIEQGQITYKTQHVVVNDVVNGAVDDYKKLASDSGAKLEYHSPKQLYIIDADEDRFKEIVSKLIDNAIKYSRQGVVDIRHEVEEGTLKTIVKDNGIGMSVQDREHIFDQFYRVQNNKTKNVNGSGLGLWIAKQHIEAMGGHIYVESTDGEGSEFTVEFPLIQNKQPTPDQEGSS